ncbi:MFS transporter [Sphingorhabdus lutea]|uniref:MFS transporter n=1 Tax=Sphingorhabdus lutea TaxID=1913578 RepID=A0A1L3JAN3_9SPHN|nr:MFS transporter [Sphingorhabdus lutea]APG62195.1 MFS transporter [Sphingorhabdus lutea]
MAQVKPIQNFAGLWNISFGFFGIQIGFALQNANMSRIFQTLGADLDNLAILWIAAPLTGLLVQPIIGHFSDRTWLGKLGRRRPYFLAGSIFAALALIIMPHAEILWFAAMMLWILDASINISMEPFRAFVGDMLDKKQHTAGYSLQTMFIGAGAVIGSIFPYALTWLGVSGEAMGNNIPDTVKYSFYFGAAAMFFSVLWTVVSTKEYSPEEMRAFNQNDPAHSNAAHLDDNVSALSQKKLHSSILWIAAGAAIVAMVTPLQLNKEIFLLGGLICGYGIISMAAIIMAKSGQQRDKDDNFLSHIVGDFAGMPPIMKKLALVQFFSWSALFTMWIYTTPVVAQYFYGNADPQSAAYQQAGDWVGILFASYNAVAVFAALIFLPILSKKLGNIKTYMAGLICGGAGFLSFFLFTDPIMLLFSEIGVGIAWATILAMPYSILASNLPAQKMGVYMGLFNIFIVVPQLLVATIMGSIVNAFFPNEPIWTMAIAGGTLFLAAIATLWIKTEDEGMKD